MPEFHAIFMQFQIESPIAVLLACGISSRSNLMDPSPATAATSPKSTVTNVIDDPSVSLQRFDLLDLQPYT